jgi:hypothetical protein
MKTLRWLAAALVICMSAISAHALDARFDAAPPQTIAIGEIGIGEVLAAKTNEYGAREVERLRDALRGDLERELGRIGRLADRDAAGAVLEVVIEDAMPNRPTPQQQTVGARPRDPRAGGAGPMDPRSVFIGGARVSATLVAPEGAALGSFAYEWQTTPDITRSQYAVTWTDAHRTFDRFARRLADAIAAQGDRGN